VSDEPRYYEITVTQSEHGFTATAKGRATGKAKGTTRAEAIDKAIDDAEWRHERHQRQTVLDDALTALVRALRETGWESIEMDLSTPMRGPSIYSGVEPFDEIEAPPHPACFKLTAQHNAWRVREEAK
jgi:hypothetical protein